jgi:hypothetical protein
MFLQYLIGNVMQDMLDHGPNDAQDRLATYFLFNMNAILGKLLIIPHTHKRKAWYATPLLHVLIWVQRTENIRFKYHVP